MERSVPMTVLAGITHADMAYVGASAPERHAVDDYAARREHRFLDWSAVKSGVECPRSIEAISQIGAGIQLRRVSREIFHADLRMSGRLLRELRIKRSLKVMGVEVSGLRAP